MANNQDSTTRINVDVTKFNASIQEAKRQIKLANAEFNEAASKLDNWGRSTEGVQAKLTQLTTKEEAQKKILEELKNKYKAVAEAEGEGSEGAEKLRLQILNQEAAVNRTQREIERYNETLAQLEEESRESSSVTSKLKEEIEDQEKELEKAKKKYIDLILEQGEGSQEAESLARKIESLSGELQENRTKLSEAERAADEFDGTLEELEETSEEASKGFSVIKGTLANLVADGIKTAVSGLKDLAIELLNDSSNAYAQFTAATGTATDAMGEYEAAIKNVYKNNFGENLQDVAEKMTKVKEITGELDASNLEDMTEKALTLEETFDMDMAETLRGVKALMNHFGMTSDEAFDLIASGAQNGLNYTDELGDNVSEYSGKFAEAGFTAKEYFQLLKNGAEGGAYNLDKINDAVNEVTTRLGDGTIADSITAIDEKTGEVKEGTGVWSAETEKLFAAWQNGEATQKDVIASMVSDIQNAEGEQEKMNLAALAFGTMAEDGGTKFIEALTPVGDVFDNVKGKADELAAVKYNTPQAALQGIGRTLKTDLLGPLADELTPKLNNLATWVASNLPDFIEKVKDIANKGKDVAIELEKWTPLIEGIGVAIATYFVVTQIAAFVGWIKSGAAAIKAMEIAQAALNVVMSISPIGIIIALIAGLVVAFVTLWNKSEGFRNFWIELWEKIKEAVNGFIDFFKNLPENVQIWFDNTMEKAKEFGEKMKEKATETGKKFVANLVNFIKNLPSKIGYYIGYTLTKVILWAANMQKKAIEAGSKFISAVIDYIRKLPEKTWNWLLTTIAKAENFRHEMEKKAKAAAEDFIKKIIEYLTNLPQKTKEKFDKTIEKAKEFVTNLGTKGKEAGNELLEKIKEGVKDLPSKMAEIGKNIVDGVWKGIQNAKAKFVQDVKDFFGGIVTGAKEVLDINSPSRVMRDQIGKNIVLGIAEGIKQNKENVKNAMQQLVEEAEKEGNANFNLGVNVAKGNVVAGYATTTGIGNTTTSNTTNNNSNYTFNQYNISPKALSRLEIYRQTQRQFKLANGVR